VFSGRGRGIALPALVLHTEARSQIPIIASGDTSSGRNVGEPDTQLRRYAMGYLPTRSHGTRTYGRGNG
jgi:hypothetical protein